MEAFKNECTKAPYYQEEIGAYAITTRPRRDEDGYEFSSIKVMIRDSPEMRIDGIFIMFGNRDADDTDIIQEAQHDS